MKTTAFKKTEVWTIVFSLIFTLALSTAEAQQKFKMAGTGNYTEVDGKGFNIDDAQGHAVYLNKYEANNISTGETEWMHNARTVNIALNDITKGNGSHHGYWTLEKGSDRIVLQYEGKITNTLSEEGNPVTTFNGKARWVNATGKYENMHGVATYKGWSIAPGTYTVEWEGEFWKKENLSEKMTR